MHEKIYAQVKLVLMDWLISYFNLLLEILSDMKYLDYFNFAFFIFKELGSLKLSYRNNWRFST